MISLIILLTIKYISLLFSIYLLKEGQNLLNLINPRIIIRFFSLIKSKTACNICRQLIIIKKFFNLNVKSNLISNSVWSFKYKSNHFINIYFLTNMKQTANVETLIQSDEISSILIS